MSRGEGTPAVISLSHCKYFSKLRGRTARARSSASRSAGVSLRPSSRSKSSAFSLVVDRIENWQQTHTLEVCPNPLPIDRRQCEEVFHVARVTEAPLRPVPDCRSLHHRNVLRADHERGQSRQNDALCCRREQFRLGALIQVEHVNVAHVLHGMNVIRKTLGRMSRLVAERFSKRYNPLPLRSGNDEVNVVGVPLISPCAHRKAARNRPTNILAVKKL